MVALLEILRDGTADWTRRSPASEATIDALSAECDFALPCEYLAFLLYSNGGEGVLCIEPWYFQLCSAEDVVEYNQGYNVEVFLPGWFAIGSNGGDEMLVIRKHGGSPCGVYTVPFIPMALNEVVEITHDFEMFAMALGRHGTKT